MVAADVLWSDQGTVKSSSRKNCIYTELTLTVNTGRGTSVVAADVLWSDPVLEEGLQENELRGVGVIFGPDVTQVRVFVIISSCSSIAR